MGSSAELNLLAAALAQAQGEMRPAMKTKTAKIIGGRANFEYRYADLADCWEVIREPLAKNGLAVVQMPRVNDGKITMTTMLMHASGQYISDDLVVEYAYGDLRSLGSAISYLRRFHLSSIVGLVSEIDDDAGHNDDSGRNYSDDAPLTSSHPPSPPIEELQQQLQQFKVSLNECPSLDSLENRYKSVYRAVYGWRNNDLLKQIVAHKKELENKFEGASE